jgi:drug/metabolite transporter (DMT)-like permease
MSFRRLNRWELLAMVAALALLLVMALDWYTDKTAQFDRFLQHQIVTPLNNQTDPSPAAILNSDAAHREKNAWQASAAIDRIILIALLAAAGLAIAAGFRRATGGRGPPRLSALATVVGLFGSVLVLYRIFQPPGPNYAAVVRIGAPLGLVCVGLLTLGSRLSTLRQRDEPVSEPAEPEVAAPAS